MKDLRLSIIILNTNRKHDTLACLESLRNSDYQPGEIIILDNSSIDGTVEAVQDNFPEVTVVSLLENKGYAGNNNVGIKLALKNGADWVFILNEDTVVSPDCLEFLMTTGESDERIGLVGPMVFHFNENKIIQSAGGSINQNWKFEHIGSNQEDHAQFIDTQDVDWISGCAMLIRGETLREIGLFDERFFYYWEEVDLCLRAKQHGWTIHHVPYAKIWHKGVSLNYSPSPITTYYSTRNKLLLLNKHSTPIRVRLLAFADLARTIVSWSIKPKWKNRRAHRNAMINGFTDYLLKNWGEMKAPDII